MKRGADGSVVAAPIWNGYMREVTKDMPIVAFKPHELEECKKPMVCGELSGAEPVVIDTMSGKLATEYTPYTTRQEKTFMEVHNILYYVNSNDPLGDPLSDYNNDPQYRLWEEPVRAWAEKEGYETQQAPTEYDDVHLPELRPTISWQKPDNNQTISQARINLEVNADAPRGVKRVEYFLDNAKIATSYQSPFDYNYTINPFLSNGRHQLKAMAFDDKDNFRETSIDVNLEVDSAEREFNIVWLYPANGDTLYLGDFPINLELSIDNPERIQKIDFYYLSPDNKSQWFTYILPGQNNISVPWDKDLEPGVYKLYMVVKDLAGSLITTPGIIVNLE